MRDKETVAKLHVLVAEMELNARKKYVFIQKLKVLILLYQPEVAKEDRQIATKLNRLREEMLVLCEKRRNIAHELRIFRSIVVISKAAEFVAESVRKANDQAVQMRDVVLSKKINADGVSCMLTPELARAANSNDIRDQLSVLFKREVDEASEKMHEYGDYS
ncbi:hypothetical protein Tco_1304484 [Tanacetum coccineum]